MPKPKPNPPAGRAPAALRRLWPALLPVLLVALVYGQVTGFGFVNLDDDQYVYENPHVLGGLSGANLGWALTSGHQGVWIPATWISLQLDAQLSGPGAAGFHRTNLLLHAVNAVLVYLLVLALTGGRWRAAIVAAVFAAHPLNAEAVAWVTARKDLLAAAWTLGAVLCWWRAQAPTGAAWRSRWAWGALACAAVALAAKPQAVVLPGLLVLVAQWRRDEDRWTWRALGRDAVAVLPFVVLSAAAAVAAVRLAHGEQFGEITPVPLDQRVADAPAYVWRYLAKLARPAGLAPVYPVEGLHVSGAWGAALLTGLLAVTSAAWAWRRAWPAFLFGWLWFLAWLLPVLGLVSGGQLMQGDRYAYLAMVGIVFLLVQAGAGAIARRPGLRVPLAVLAVAVIGLGAAAARLQAQVWRDPVPLWTHTLAVTEENAFAHQNLAVVLEDRGRPADAWEHLQAALAIDPDSRAHYNAGNALYALGRTDEAEAQYRRALALNPGLVEAALNLGSLLGEAGRLDEARAVLLRAERQAPELAAVQFNLGLVAYVAGDREEAAARLRRTLELEPGHGKARELLARIGGS